MDKKKILVIEDEEDIQELLSYNLWKADYEPLCAGSGEEGLKLAVSAMPDIILLDLMLPGINGLEVCKTIKGDSITKDIGIIMLTARGEESDIVVGLELGADDYITKPFSPKVLLARIKALLRRKAEGVQNSENAVINIAGITIHPGRREVLIEGNQTELTATEFALLHLLARRPGWVYTRQQILDGARGHDYIATERSVDVQVVGLRKKLGDAGKKIETVRGVGYRFKE